MNRGAPDRKISVRSDNRTGLIKAGFRKRKITGLRYLRENHFSSYDLLILLILHLLKFENAIETSAMKLN